MSCKLNCTKEFMALVKIPEEVYTLASRISVTFALFLSIITILWHISRVKRELKERRTKWSYLLAYTFILQFFLALCLVALIYTTFFSAPTQISCKIAVYSPSMFYFISKWALYMLLSFRLDAAFHESKYAYSRLILNFWRVCLAFGILLEMFVLYFTTSVDVIDTKNSSFPCRIGTTNALSLCIVVVDFVACFVNAYMFINPLKKAVKAIQTHRNIFDTTAVNIMNNIQQTTIQMASSNIDSSTKYNSEKNLQISDTGSSSIDRTNNMSPTNENRDLGGTGPKWNPTSGAESESGSATPRISWNGNPKISNRARSLQRKQHKFLHIIRKTTVLTVIAVSFTIVTLLLIYVFAMTAVWYVNLHLHEIATLCNSEMIAM